MVIANFIGILLFLFLLWKKLKEDYHYERIFNVGFLSLIGITISTLLANSFLTDFKFWLQFAGLLVGFGLAIYLQKIKFYESFDALVVAVLPWLGLNYLVLAIRNSSLIDFIAFWVCLLLVFIYFFLDSQYRKFIWYKSGRVGFSGLAVAGLFFVAKGVEFSTGFNLYLSATFAFLFFLLLFILSKSKE